MNDNEDSIKAIDRGSLADAYTLFRRTIGNLQTLKPEETAELLKEYQKNPSDDLRNTIIEGNRRLVISQGMKFVGNITNEGRKRSLALELFQEGSTALGDAVEGFRLQDGNSFSTFAVSCIKNRRLSFRQNKVPQIKTPSNIKKIIKEVNLIRKEFGKTNTHEPSDSEIIKRSKGALTQDDLNRRSEFYQKRIPVSRQQTITDDEDAPTIEENQVDTDSPQPDQVSLDNERHAHFLEAIASLDPRERDIFYSRNYLNNRKATLLELSKKYGISQERCRQIEANAEKKITEYLKRFE